MFAECIPYNKHIHHVENLSMAITCPNQPLEYVDFIIESSMIGYITTQSSTQD